MRILLFSLLFFTISCTATKNNSGNKGSLSELQQLMTGQFDSQAQSVADTTYYNITLKMIPIWKSTGEHWLYVEQAVASMQDKPYRQRVYKLMDNGAGNFVSLVYTLESPKDWIGKWKTPDDFDMIKPEDLTEREGCGVFLKKVGKNLYKGSTKDKDCTSTLRGASYASSIVTISDKQILSWDQGFDDKGEQVWGATKGGYIFQKKN